MCYHSHCNFYFKLERKNFFYSNCKCIQDIKQDTLKKKLQALANNIKAQFLRKIIKKSNRRGFKRSFSILKYFVKDPKINVKVPSNATNIDDIVNAEKQNIASLNHAIKKIIAKLQSQSGK